MKVMLKPSSLGPLLGLLLLCSCATEHSLRSQHSRDVAINKDAGRGQFLFVMLRLESGEELPFVVDTGSSSTLFDKSLAPKLGKSVGKITMGHWGTREDSPVYAAPKLFLGNTQLMISGGGIATFDFKELSTSAGRPIMGLLGMDVLEHYCIQLDFAAGKMRFLDGEHADKQAWGKAFPIVAVNPGDTRPGVGENLFGAHGPHSLLDSGFVGADGWLMPKYFQQWTNHAVLPAKGDARSPSGVFGGEKYPLLSLQVLNVEVDGIGLGFLARHLVTLDFPRQTVYLKRQSIGPLPNPRMKTTRMEAMNPLIMDVIQEDVEAARKDLVRIEQGRATKLEKTVARKLATTLENEPKPAPADVPPEVTKLSLGDLRPELAEVGWLKPAANRIPLNGEISSPLLDSGKIYATGLFAHAPSRYVYNLGGKWKALRGQAGLHTAFQPYAAGIIFVIKTDGKEVFRSSIIRGSNQPRYDVDVTGVKTLELLVEKAYVRNGGDWGLWLDPTLFRESSRNTEGHK
jgi:hypothetical protein